MRQLCLMFLADNWLWMVLPIAICAILAFFVDVRFIIVAMMILFIVMPMVLALLYFYYGFSPEARWSIMEKKLTIGNEGITLTFTDERMKSTPSVGMTCYISSKRIMCCSLCSRASDIPA